MIDWEQATIRERDECSTQGPFQKLITRIFSKNVADVSQKTYSRLHNICKKRSTDFFSFIQQNKEILTPINIKPSLLSAHVCPSLPSSFLSAYTPHLYQQTPSTPSLIPIVTLVSICPSWLWMVDPGSRCPEGRNPRTWAFQNPPQHRFAK